MTKRQSPWVLILTAMLMALLVGCRSESMMVVQPENLLRYSPIFASAGQPDEAYLQQLSKQGVDIIVNIAPHSAQGALDDERQTVATTGMQYLNIPVDWNAPTQADVETYLSFMRQHQGKHVFLHCQMNMRASAFAFLHRVINLQIDPTVARDDMLKIWTPNETWRKLINSALENHRIDLRIPAA